MEQHWTDVDGVRDPAAFGDARVDLDRSRVAVAIQTYTSEVSA
jgi:hypothetical protein